MMNSFSAPRPMHSDAPVGSELERRLLEPGSQANIAAPGLAGDLHRREIIAFPDDLEQFARLLFPRGVLPT